jgi:DNA-binding NtrC family response regulator
MEDTLRSDGLKALVSAYERQLIESALAAADGNQRRAAASLGLLPTTLHEKMKRLGLLRRHIGSLPEQHYAAS